jgi:hypothetical protein
LAGETVVQYFLTGDGVERVGLGQAGDLRLSIHCLIWGMKSTPITTTTSRMTTIVPDLPIVFLTYL